MKKEEKIKLKETRAREKYKTRKAKLMDRYGIPSINRWVKKNPRSLTGLVYELYLEEERSINLRRTCAYILLGIALVLMIVSLFVPLFLVSAFLFLFVSSDMQTNLRIDRLEQEQSRNMVYNMYLSEKEVRNETDETTES